jgi:uncharacterized protein with von Willebrand factor type A (vWA) domain
MLECYANGRDYVPLVQFAGEKLAPELVWEKRRELLEAGRDHTLAVDPFVRGLAAREADEQGVYRHAVERHAVEQWPGLERELFARLYGGAAALDEVAAGDQWLEAIHEQVGQVSEWEDLEARCEGDPWAAGIGAGRVTETLGKVLDEAIRKLAPQQDPGRLEQEAAELDEMAPGAGVMKDDQARQAEVQAEALRTELGKERVEFAIRQAVRVAADAAADQIEDLQLAMAGLGAGGGPGVLSAVNAPSEQVRKALAADPKLQRIAKLAGRLRMRARAKQRTKVNYVPEQIVDVTIGAELARLLPSELVLLAAEETELLLLRKLVERQALEYQMEGRESEDQGPILLLVDGSGSMTGARNEWAMAVGLALMEICAIQKRGFGLCHFDSSVQATFLVEPKRRLTLSELIEMVSYFSGGGTAFAPPLDWARGELGKGAWSKADVILVTDGGGGWGTAVEQLGKVGAQVYGVAIESDFSAEQKRELAGVARIDNLAEGQRWQAAAAKGAAKDDAVDLVFGGV